jgi:hypothetical protein
MHGGMEFMRSAVVRAAVEWYEARQDYGERIDEYTVATGSSKDCALMMMVLAENAWYEAWERLAEAVQRWKEAQA